MMAAPLHAGRVGEECEGDLGRVGVDSAADAQTAQAINWVTLALSIEPKPRRPPGGARATTERARELAAEFVAAARAGDSQGFRMLAMRAYETAAHLVLGFDDWAEFVDELGLDDIEASAAAPGAPVSVTRSAAPATDLILVRLDAARHALQEACSARDVKAIVDAAAAAETFALRQRYSEETIRYATEIKLDAERKLGKILKATPKAEGAAGIGKSASAVPEEYRTQPPTLAELGIDKKTSARAQKLAALTDETFEAIRSGELKMEAALRSARIAGRGKPQERPAPSGAAELDGAVRALKAALSGPAGDAIEALHNLRAIITGRGFLPRDAILGAARGLADVVAELLEGRP